MTLAADAWKLAFGGLPVTDGLAMREAYDMRYFPGSGPGRFAPLLSIADLDALLRTDAAASPRVSMANGAQTGSAAVLAESYTSEDGRIDLVRLFEAFDAGSTLVVSQLHELHPPLARFCRGLERIFLHAVQSNIYLTPPGAQGFHAHYDTHDVLVLQVAGEKTWKIWHGQPVPHPTRAVPWTRAEVQPQGEPELVVMRAGDVLYVPRGVMHEAVAQQGTEPSLHITIGLLQPSWADALRAGLDAVERTEPSVRQAFPTWRLTEPGAIERVTAETAQRLAALDADKLTQLITLRMLDRLAQERLLLSARGLLAPAPAPTDRLRLCDAVHFHVVPLDETKAELRWAGGVEPLSATELDWLGGLENGASAAELGGSDEALAFCRRLFALGLLEPAPKAAMSRAAE